ncbi:hypothetical protein HPP92_029124 [Vanilla planifolia]|uniref:Uncharacterized protein n=1 Tax=Vanilla planifolia TaxID=51239 RepID=A0A835P4T3_VANPL|nr:hypothetical protein HPP92_029124 [Vanilla planifolia]KAG0445880.1 hypothetical protein HPP92_029112 [Vanilla planifolia]
MASVRRWWENLPRKRLGSLNCNDSYDRSIADSVPLVVAILPSLLLLSGENQPYSSALKSVGVASALGNRVLIKRHNLYSSSIALSWVYCEVQSIPKCFSSFVDVLVSVHKSFEDGLLSRAVVYDQQVQ